MKLHPPFIITPRLMAGIRIGDSFVSIGYSNRAGESSGRFQRARYVYHIDTPEWEFTADDLQSGLFEHSLQSGMKSLLSFLSACSDAMYYNTHRTFPHESENADLFPPHVAEWCYQNSDELSMLQYELSETPNLIEH